MAVKRKQNESSNHHATLLLKLNYFFIYVLFISLHFRPKRILDILYSDVLYNTSMIKNKATIDDWLNQLIGSTRLDTGHQ